MIQTSSEEINSADVMYSMVTTVNNSILYIWKLLREQKLKIPTTHKKMPPYNGMDKLTNHIVVTIFQRMHISLLCNMSILSQ